MPYAFFLHIQIHPAWPGPYTLMSAHNTPPSQLLSYSIILFPAQVLSALPLDIQYIYFHWDF